MKLSFSDILAIVVPLAGLIVAAFGFVWHSIEKVSDSLETHLRDHLTGKLGDK